MAHKSIHQKAISFVNSFYDSILAFGVCHFVRTIDIKMYYEQSGYSFPALPSETMWLRRWHKLSRHVNVKFYRVYANFIGEDMDIVSDDLGSNIIEPILNPVRYRSTYADKNMFDQVLKMRFSERVTPETYLRNMGTNKWLLGDYTPILSKDISFEQICESEVIISKPSIDSTSGRSVMFYHKTDKGIYVEDSTNKKLTVELLNEFYPDGNFIIQKRVKQSPFINQFCSTAICTLRLMVYRSVKTGECHVLNHIMRMGKEGANVDNAHAGGSFIAIHKDGSFFNYVCDQTGHRENVFNGIDFSKNTFIVPEWDRIKEFAIKVCECVPHCHLFALDIMLDENNNPRLIEYNLTAFSYWLYQFNQGTAFGEFTEEVYNYCLENKDKCSRVFVSF